ncbi:MAG: hypothetical protein K1Y36_10145 [Blastocatellia bacterium]|nr:hypothetical protein [Blastocatellia bacterium]
MEPTAQTLIPLDSLHLESFTPWLGTAFVVSNATTPPQEFVLEEAFDRRSTPRNECFALFFRGPVEPYWPQGIYQFSHPSLGQMELFTVPVGKDPDGVRYEVIINRLLKQ